MALLTLLALGPGAAPGEAQTGRIGPFCAGQFVNPPNCTANDVLIEGFFIEDVIEDCTEGTPFEAEVEFAGLIAGAAPARYGIGLFINLEGESAIAGDLCLHDYLAPFSSNPDEWQTDPGTGAFIEPFPEINGDQCGDIPAGNNEVLKSLQRVRIACADTDGDGFVDIHACSAWENNQNAQCNGIEDAVPATPSKCGCGLVATELPLPARVTVIKETTEGDDTFGFFSDLPADSFSISTSGGTGQQGPLPANPGTYSISEDVPAGWDLDAATCDNGDSPDSLTVGPGDAVTCTFVDSPRPLVPPAIIIEVETGDGDDTFDYSGDLGDFEIPTSGGGGDQRFEDLDPGIYDVIEEVPSGSELDSITCSNDSTTDTSTATAHIEVTEDEIVTCTFAHEPEPVPALPMVAATLMTAMLAASAAWALRRARA